MSKFEQKIIDILIANRILFFLCMVTILSLFIRFCYRDFISIDAEGFLLPWYDEIKEKGINSLASQVGDYNILYQFIIYVFTLLPIKSLYAYKLLSVIFDYALAIIVSFLMVDDKKGQKLDLLKSYKFAEVYCVVLFSPIVFLNSSCWAQCDSIYTFFVFAALYSYNKEKYGMMFMLLGMAFSFKFQTIFILPFLLILYVMQKRFSLAYFFIIPLTLVVSALPGIIMGRSIMDPFSIYMNQTGTYNTISLNYNSFWNIIGGWSGGESDFAEFKIMAVVFTTTILGGILMKVISSNYSLDLYGLILLLHITTYTCILFLPTMHERYGFIYEITAILLVFFDKRFFFYGVGVILLSCMTYGYFLFGVEYPSLIMSIFNVALYCGYVYRFSNSCKPTNIAFE